MPILRCYTAYWGPNLALKAHTLPNTVASFLKLQLAHDNPMRQYFHDVLKELASHITLVIGGIETKHNEQVHYVLSKV